MLTALSMVFSTAHLSFIMLWMFSPVGSSISAVKSEMAARATTDSAKSDCWTWNFSVGLGWGTKSSSHKHGGKSFMSTAHVLTRAKAAVLKKSVYE